MTSQVSSGSFRTPSASRTTPQVQPTKLAREFSDWSAMHIEADLPMSSADSFGNQQTCRSHSFMRSGSTPHLSRAPSHTSEHTGMGLDETVSTPKSTTKPAFLQNRWGQSSPQPRQEQTPRGLPPPNVAAYARRKGERLALQRQQRSHSQGNLFWAPPTEAQVICEAMRAPSFALNPTDELVAPTHQPAFAAVVTQFVAAGVSCGSPPQVLSPSRNSQMAFPVLKSPQPQSQGGLGLGLSPKRTMSVGRLHGRHGSPRIQVSV